MPIHVDKGSRVFVESLQMFGDVIKTKTLGADGVVVQCDDGSVHAVYGNNVEEKVFDKSTSKNGKGDQVELPTDVKVIGPQVLESIGVDEQTRAALFQKFMVLEESVRLEKASYWEANRNNAAAMSTFLPELMTLLGGDTLFIQAKSAKLLAHLDDDVRSAMLTSMMAKTTAEERKAMILQYTSIQNDRRRVEDFLQGLYELLLDNKTYIAMEFKKSLEKMRVFPEESSPMIAAFLANSSESELEGVVEKWRKRKYYRSRKGPRFSYEVVKEFS